MNHKKFLIPASIAMSLMLASCSSSSKGKNSGLEDANNAGMSDSDLSVDGQRDRYGNGSIPTASEGTTFPDIHFDFDSSAVKQEDYPIVEKNARMLASDSSLRMEVEGHCDKRGTAEYNLALGEERAKAVSALLVSYGAKPAQLSTISYGEEIPLDPRDSDDAYAKNRRVHFAVFRGGQGGSAGNAKSGSGRAHY